MFTINEITPSIINEINLNCEVESFGSSKPEAKFMVNPKDYLKYAEIDLDQNTDHGLLNCLSNTKRAIECQIDTLLLEFCLYKLAKKKNLGFPSKVRILNDVGIISPRILNKINKARNLIEHSYEVPDKEQVEDALDVATLFVHYTDKFLLGVNSFDIRSISESLNGYYSIELDDESQSISILFNNRDLPESLKKDIKADSEEYIEYLKIFCQLHDLYYKT